MNYPTVSMHQYQLCSPDSLLRWGGFVVNMPNMVCSLRNAVLFSAVSVFVVPLFLL